MTWIVEQSDSNNNDNNNGKCICLVNTFANLSFYRQLTTGYLKLSDNYTCILYLKKNQPETNKSNNNKQAKKQKSKQRNKKQQQANKQKKKKLKFYYVWAIPNLISMPKDEIYYSNTVVFRL